MKLFRGLIESLKGVNEFLKDMEELPKKIFHGEFYEGRKRAPQRARCANQVRVEDLRPQPRDRDSA